jgi:Amt family ammonium transporter
VDTGDTAWVLASAALVLLMTPGLALFYGGMVRAKSVLNMMMMSFGALALISVLWVLYGYSMAFGNDVGGGLVGSPFEFFGLSTLLGTEGVDNGFAATSLVFTIPSMAFVAFQAVFAIITVALISGAIADRARVDQLWRQVVGALAVLVFSFVVTWIIGTVIQKTMGFRITDEDEVAGIDSVEHAETAYDFASLGGSGGGATSLVGQAHAEARNTEGVRA